MYMYMTVIVYYLVTCMVNIVSWRAIPRKSKKVTFQYDKKTFRFLHKRFEWPQIKSYKQSMSVKHDKTLDEQLNHCITKIINMFEIRGFVPLTYAELCI